MKRFKKVYVEITNTCNLNCSFCSVSSKVKKSLTKEEFRHILKEIRPYTDYIYLHVKGEPLLHPELDELLTIAEKYLMKVNITTNGTLFPKVFPILKKHSCIHQINFSLHSENNIPNYCEQIFAKVDELSTDILIIYRFWALKDEKLNKKSTNIVERMQEHYHLSQNIVDKIKNEKHVQISSHIFVDKQEEFDWPSVEKSTKEDGYCYGLKSHIAVLVDGTVVPCCLDGEGVIDLGNIFTESLETILNKPRTKAIIDGFRQRSAVEPLCRSCTFKNRF